MALFILIIKEILICPSTLYIIRPATTHSSVVPLAPYFSDLLLRISSPRSSNSSRGLKLGQKPSQTLHHKLLESPSPSLPCSSSLPKFKLPLSLSRVLLPYKTYIPFPFPASTLQTLTLIRNLFSSSFGPSHGSCRELRRSHERPRGGRRRPTHRKIQPHSHHRRRGVSGECAGGAAADAPPLRLLSRSRADHDHRHFCKVNTRR